MDVVFIPEGKVGTYVELYLSKQVRNSVLEHLDTKVCKQMSAIQLVRRTRPENSWSEG